MNKIKNISEALNEQLTVTLRYVSDSLHPGLKRVKKGKSFSYIDHEGNLCKSEDVLKRIKSLVIPPAWKDVWICLHADGHLQATGVDTKNRKQYRYHPAWVQLRNEDKFYRLRNFGFCLADIREKVANDLKRSGMGKDKVVALIISLLESTCIRIGNECYQKLYGSHGLTTMRDKHVKFDGTKVIFRFKGKKGVYHDISCGLGKLAQLVKKCKDIPGQELFQYYDENGSHHPVSSDDVNDYLKSITGMHYTAKDFRTWSGSVMALKFLLEKGIYETKKECKQNVIDIIDQVSEKLGNTRTVCKKYYIHPVVISNYEDNTLISKLVEGKIKELDKRLNPEENLLLNLLDAERKH
jgi:DNA topoisomerase-1